MILTSNISRVEVSNEMYHCVFTEITRIKHQNKSEVQSLFTLLWVHNTVVTCEMTSGELSVCLHPSGNIHLWALLYNPHGKLVDSLRLLRAFLVCQSAEARTCSAVDPPPTSPALNNEWPFSHYVPTSRPLAGPFPRPFTNLTAQPRDPHQLTGDTFQESVNDDELEKNIFILPKVHCFGVFFLFLNQGNWRNECLDALKKRQYWFWLDDTVMKKHFLFLQGRLVPPGQQGCATCCCRSVLPRCVCLLGR